MSKRKAVKTISVGSLTTLGVLSASVGKGTNGDTDEIVAFGDSVVTNVPRAITKFDELTIECLDEGNSLSGLDIGDVQTISLSIGYWDGTTTTTKSVSVECSLTGIEYSTASVDGERKATVTMKWLPVGGTSTSPSTGA